MTPREILEDGCAEHAPRVLLALFSGGDDSLTATHIAAQHPLFKAVVHLDTGTGVPETRAFVEETCRREGWPLEVYSAPAGTYERLVLEGYTTRAGKLCQGFPSGPKSHATMYWYLKQRQLRAAIRAHKQRRRDRVGFVAGIRVAESDRRMQSAMAQPHYKEADRSAVWLHPILDWSKAECLEYLAAHHIPRNPVAVNCHRSGECLCGALANHAELGEIAFFYPHVGERFARLAQRVTELGIASDQWAGGPTGWRRTTPRSAAMLPLCTSCIQTRFEGW